MNIVGIRYWPNNATRVPDRQRVGRDVSSDHAACTNHTTIANRNAADDDDVAGDPAVVADIDGLGILIVVFVTIWPPFDVSILVSQRMHRRCQRHVGAKHHVIANLTGQSSRTDRLALP